MIEFLFNVFLCMTVASFFEWGIHKYLLHGKKFGANKKSWWHFHWGEHHRNVRRNDYYEMDYKKSVFRKNAHQKEVLSLLLGAVLLTPMAYINDFFYCYGLTHLVVYYLVHRYSHLYPEFGKKYFPWHYAHHMSWNQHRSWCVTFPIADWIMGTRPKAKKRSS